MPSRETRVHGKQTAVFGAITQSRDRAQLSWPQAAQARVTKAPLGVSILSHRAGVLTGGEPPGVLGSCLEADYHLWEECLADIQKTMVNDRSQM